MPKPSRKILLVDGYNVIHRLTELRPSREGLENAQNRLVLLLSDWRRAHPEFECVIVFDGNPPPGGGPQGTAGTRCVFTRTPHGGDAAIVGFVRDHQGRKSDITVVSDDNYVKNNCRAHGAAVQPSSFILIRKPAPTAGRPKPPDGGKGIDRKTADEINKELRKKFLSSFWLLIVPAISLSFIPLRTAIF
jgi:predicted RNA-binding protein with PIN domain